MTTENKKALIKFLAAFIITLATLIGVSALCIDALKSTFNADDYTVESYYVQQGDTLWGIAESHREDSCKIQDYIYEVKKLNDSLDSGKCLWAGDIIKIYVPTECK